MLRRNQILGESIAQLTADGVFDFVEREHFTQLPRAKQRDGLEETCMWEDYNYCWVVLCKNNWFHGRQNLFSKHRIPLAETDVYMPPPALKNSFTVKCDECNKEYLYKPSEVLRHDQELPASFSPHPLFQPEFMPSAVELTDQKAAHQGDLDVNFLDDKILKVNLLFSASPETKKPRLATSRT
jgi:hypothetical protein